MIKTIITTLAITTGILAATSASAADFTGLRAEAHVGYDRVSFFGIDQDGFAYGVGLGYDFAVGTTTILGVEVNADLASTNFSGSIGSITASLDMKRDLSALVRFGNKFGDKTLVYVKAGYANGRLEANLRDTRNPANNVSGAVDGDGIRGAIGVEYAITPKAYAKLEYQYTNYEADFSRHQGLVGIGFRF